MIEMYVRVWLEEIQIIYFEIVKEIGEGKRNKKNIYKKYVKLNIFKNVLIAVKLPTEITTGEEIV